MSHDHIHPHSRPHHHPHTDHQMLPRRNFLRLSALGLASVLLSSCGKESLTQAVVGTQAEQLPPPTIEPATALAQATVIATREAVESALSGFEAFRDQTNLIVEGNYLRVESSGVPTHGMMIGIRSWQQQVPLPQNYNGNNAWSIPLNPVLSDNPISGKTALYRGAIALAVNGIPIFNALNNRGDDAYLAGELDDWGGHCGRADDYHYHIAPLHLYETLGIDKPIAYALDGFPLYGISESDGSVVTGLDEYNGHLNEAGDYHYHASETYPYINGGLRGVIGGIDGDQVEPQPRTTPIRPSGEPLNGAVITGFEITGGQAYSLEYTLNNQKYYVNYYFDNTSYTFEFVDAAGNTRTETYSR